MTITQYIKNINQRYKTGISREHAYRGDLQNLMEGMLKNVLVTNEPARIACGAPDFILTHNTSVRTFFRIDIKSASTVA